VQLCHQTSGRGGPNLTDNTDSVSASSSEVRGSVLTEGSSTGHKKHPKRTNTPGRQARASTSGDHSVTWTARQPPAPSPVAAAQQKTPAAPQPPPSSATPIQGTTPNPNGRGCTQQAMKAPTRSPSQTQSPKTKITGMHGAPNPRNSTTSSSALLCWGDKLCSRY